MRARSIAFTLLCFLFLACGPTETTDSLSCGQGWRDVVWSSDGDDEVLGLASLRQGQLAAVGYQGGVAGDRPDPMGDAQAWLRIYRPNGQLLGQQRFDTPGADVLDAVSQPADSEDLVVAGRTTAAFPGTSNQGAYDGFVSTLDGASWIPRNLIQFGSERPQHPRRVVASGAGILVAGYDDVHIPSNYVQSWEDPFLALVQSAQGDPSAPLRLEWFRPWLSEPPDQILGLAWDAARDAVFIAGSRMAGPDRGAFVERRDLQGTIRWSRRISDVPVDAAAAVLLAPDGDVLVGGSSFRMIGARSYGGQDAFVMKLRADSGQTVWAGQAGSPGADWVGDMAVDARGHVYLAGETLGVLAEGGVYAGESDVFVVEFDGSGAWLAAWQDGSPGDDRAHAVAVDGCGQVLVAGYSRGPLRGRASAGGRDGFILRADLKPR